MKYVREPAPVPSLEGPRIRLRELVECDTDALFALHSDERLMRYWSFAAWTERRQAVEHIARLAREREVLEFYPWVAVLKGDDRAIGTCSLFGVRRDHARCVIGYSLSPSLWRRGYASEMLHLAIGFAFGPLALNRIEADIDPMNLASCALVERAGFRREGVLRERWRVGGGVQDTALYGLLRRDYRSSSERSIPAHDGSRSENSL